MNLEKKHFEGDLDFDLQPHPPAWTLESELMET